MQPRPSTPSSIPSKLTINFVLPCASELATKEVTFGIFPICLQFCFLNAMPITFIILSICNGDDLYGSLICKNKDMVISQMAWALWQQSELNRQVNGTVSLIKWEALDVLLH
ncbi:ATP synthase subunit delta', mitochondrial [Gossypium australe]|uniref:ATP synthase subunit delta', mitochondrial n=1 Tax=Gossypium australe TaxID=47621 RepID=A0A5B6VE75_9ROSI|nr:ATP synthase subunit delta', mitochondrial [Gossypium australe]